MELQALAVLGLGRDDEAFRLLAVAHLDGGVGQKGDLFLKGTLVQRQPGVVQRGLPVVLAKLPHHLVGVFALGQCLLAGLGFGLLLLLLIGLGGLSLLLALVEVRLDWLLVEPLVGLAQERQMIVKAGEVERAVDVELPVILYGIAERGAVFEVGATYPVVGRAIRRVAVDPVEDGNEVQGQLVRQREVLLIVEGRAEVTDAGPHRILPRVVAGGVQVFVDGGIRLLHLGMGGTLEIGVQVLREVPAQLELAVPQELF